MSQTPIWLKTTNVSARLTDSNQPIFFLYPWWSGSGQQTDFKKQHKAPNKPHKQTVYNKILIFAVPCSLFTTGLAVEQSSSILVPTRGQIQCLCIQTPTTIGKLSNLLKNILSIVSTQVSLSQILATILSPSYKRLLHSHSQKAKYVL